MSRQLLPRQRTEMPARARTGAAAAAPAAAPAAGGSGPRLRRPAVLALVAGATAALAGLGWMLLKAPGDTEAGDTSVLVRPRTPAAASPTPTPTPTAPAGAVPTTAAGPTRDPFGGAPVAAGPSTRPPAPGVVSGTARPGGPATAPTTAPTTAPAAGPTGAPAPATVTVTRTASPTATPTVTMTAPGSAVYLGFYLWNGDKASFRVNARTYSKPVGSTFGPQITFTAIVKGTPRCAKVTYQGKGFTLCPGQVVQLP